MFSQAEPLSHFVNVNVEKLRNYKQAAGVSQSKNIITVTSMADFTMSLIFECRGFYSVPQYTVPLVSLGSLGLKLHRSHIQHHRL